MSATRLAHSWTSVYGYSALKFNSLFKSRPNNEGVWGLIPVTVMYFHAERGLGLANSFEGEKKKSAAQEKKRGGGVWNDCWWMCIASSCGSFFFCCLKLANRCLEWWYVNCTIHPQEGTDDVGALPSPRVVLLICVVDRALHLNPQCGSIRNLLSLLLLL